MAKGFGKFLMFSAAVGAAAAGAYYYLQNKEDFDLEEKDDFDGFTVDTEDAPASAQRGYTVLTPEKVSEAMKKVTDLAGDAVEIAQGALEGAKEVIAEVMAKKDDESLDEEDDDDIMESETFFEDDEELVQDVPEQADEATPSANE